MYNSSEGSSGVMACAVLGTDIERNASFIASTSCGAICTASKLCFIKKVSLVYFFKKFSIEASSLPTYCMITSEFLISKCIYYSRSIFCDITRSE